MPEKPLHVRVAEALGCQIVTFSRNKDDMDLGLPMHDWNCGCTEYRPGTGVKMHSGGFGILDYPTDWFATGPLIEKYKIRLRWGHGAWYASPCLIADVDETYGETALDAVCYIILALAAAGKLKGG